MIQRDQPERAEAPKYKCVGETRQGPLLDHFALESDLPEEVPDTGSERREMEIRRRPRAADDVHDRAQAPAEHRDRRPDQQKENEALRPGNLSHSSQLDCSM